MEKDIVKKINAELGSGIHSEKDVLYFMAESRKLLDHGESKKFRTLRFYCNWALHVEIKDVWVFLDFFRAVNGHVVAYLSAPSFRTRQNLNKFISEFLSFARLKKDLQIFMTHERLDNRLLREMAQWKEFTKHMKEIIIDSPLVLDKLSKEITGNKLTQFRLTRNGFFRLPEEMPYIAWEIWVDTSPVPMTGFIPEN